MTKFKEWLQITEIFNDPFPIKWSRSRQKDWIGKFMVEDKPYIITMINGGTEMPWEVKFELIQNKKPTQEITGTGDAMQVFSTVLSGIQQWLKSENPDSFVLSAAEPNRQQLYRRMMGMLPKNYKYEDLGSTFFVQNINAKQPAFSGYSDSDFEDYYYDY